MKFFNYLPIVNQSCRKVDKTCNDCPCRVYAKTVEDKPVGDSPPEKWCTPSKILSIISDVLGKEDHDENVCNSDEEQANTSDSDET